MNGGVWRGRSCSYRGNLLEVSRGNRLPRQDETSEGMERQGVSRVKGKQAFSRVELPKAGIKEKPKSVT